VLRTITGGVQKSIKFVDLCIEEKADLALVWKYPLTLNFPRGVKIPTFEYMGEEPLVVILGEAIKMLNPKKIFIYANLPFEGEKKPETEQLLREIHDYALAHDLDVIITLQTERTDPVALNHVEF